MMFHHHYCWGADYKQPKIILVTLLSSLKLLLPIFDNLKEE